MTTLARDEVSRDAFLGGRLHLYQPIKGYRAGLDPVLLAASVEAKPGQNILDLGCGVGAAGLCLAARVPDLHVTGVELQAQYAALAHRNALENAVRMDVITASIADLPKAIRQQRFDHVIANPPYYRAETGTLPRDQDVSLARAEELPIEMWVSVAAKRCAPRGQVTFIQQANRLPELLAAFQARLGSVVLTPIYGHAGNEARLILLSGRPQGRAALKIQPPVVLNAEECGPAGSGYTPHVTAVLRDGAAL